MAHRRMPVGQQRTRLDPLLERLLDAAPDDAAVEAVVQLHPIGRTAPAATAEETARRAHQLVERVQRESGAREHGLNVFANLGSFAISAPPRFVRTLIAQPEVASVVGNREAVAEPTPPASSRSVTLADVGRRQHATRPRRSRRGPKV